MITVFGSLNADLVCQVAQLPGPGETVIGPDYTVVPGGKGANQALAAARAGAAVRMVGSVGRDAFAETALRSLREEGVDLAAIAEREGRTACAFIGVDPAGQNLIIVASGANLETRAAQLRRAGLEAGDVLLLQMEVPHLENWEAVAFAKQAGAQVVLNLAPAGPVPAEVLRQVDVLIVNETEAAQLAGQLGLAERDPQDVGARLAADFVSHCIVTLGRAGVASYGAAGSRRLPALAVEVVDTTAAGDAFVGGFAAALEAGRAMEDCLAQGIVTGGLACRHLGAQSSLPAQREIAEALASYPA
ncbi:ribokinase [Pelagibius sp. CAU 1746]|uniref:ribokinase n=1 Tax=Pelagibius sp. CAU 1746 TaxID=3140370 RepID=UPI00325BAD9C